MKRLYRVTVFVAVDTAKALDALNETTAETVAAMLRSEAQAHWDSIAYVDRAVVGTVTGTSKGQE